MKSIGMLMIFGTLALIPACMIPVARLGHTCVICRLDRVDATCLGVTLPSYDENECSRWYATHVERSHRHVWERGTCCYESNLLGMPRGVGCRPGHYPIKLLDPATQMRAYQHFKDPLGAKKLFENLTDEKTHGDQIDECDYPDRGYLIVGALEGWESAGFPGTWDEWWTRSYADHVAEHKEYLIWMRADGGLNFRDWQDQQQKRAPDASPPPMPPPTMTE